MQRGFEWPGSLLLATLILLSPVFTHAQMFQMHPGDSAHSRMHPLNTECSICHISGRDTMAGNAGMLTGNQEALCARCHSNSLKNSHPSGFSLPHGYKISTRYPLDWKGNITCSTCHEVHSDLPGKLRDNVRGRDMCRACHNQEFFDNMDKNRAHLLAP